MLTNMISSSRELIWHVRVAVWFIVLSSCFDMREFLSVFWSRTKSHLVLHGVWGVKCLKPSSYIVLVLVADHFVFQQLTTASKGGLNQLYGLVWVSKPLQNWASDHRALMRAYRISLYSISGALAITSMICLSSGYRRNKEHASCIFLHSSNRMQDWARSCLFHVFPWTLHIPVITTGFSENLSRTAECKMQTLLMLKESEIHSRQKTVRTTRPSQLPQLLSVPTKDPACFFDTFNFKEINQRFDLESWSPRLMICISLIKVLLVIFVHIFTSTSKHLKHSISQHITTPQPLAPQLHERSALGPAVPHQPPHGLLNTPEDKCNKMSERLCGHIW